MAEAPARYCSNCGNELGLDDQFCKNCGQPVGQTARVPTPEADVPVPPPPQQQSGQQAPPQQQAGPPPPRRSTTSKVLIGCVGLVVLSVLFVGCLAVFAVGGGDGTGGDQQAQDSGQGGGQAPASIGEKVVVGDSAYTVTNAQQETRLESPNGFDRPMTGNFLVVDFTVENLGDEPMTVSDIGLYVYDDQDRQFETETDVPLGYIPESKDLYLLDRINPGLSQSVRVVFSVPPDSQGYEMEVSSGMLASETRRISLGF
jgi:hypothetical protein